MPLSKAALMCLESSPLLKTDVLFAKRRYRFMRREKVRDEFVERPSMFPIQYQRLRLSPGEFFQNVHMSVEVFDYILDHVAQDLALANNSKHKTPEEKLFITLRYLTGSMPIKQLSRTYCAEPKMITKIIYMTLIYIWKNLSPIHLRPPTPAEVHNLAKEYNEKWKFPNCVGAIGGKYIRVANPYTDTTKKATLNAVVDANFRFLTLYFEKKRCAGESFVRNMFNISGMQCLPGTEVMLPLFVIGNDAYPLKPNLMKPYSRKLAYSCLDKTRFNDRLKHARVPVDCAFEILTEKWKIFTTTLTIGMEETTMVAKAACLLHNIIKDIEGERDPHFSRFGHVDNGCIYLNLVSHSTHQTGVTSSVAAALRDQLRDYLRDHDPWRVMTDCNPETLQTTS